MIGDLFELVVVKSIGVSLLLIVLVAIRPFILSRLNGKVAYALWLIIPVYLLMPAGWSFIGSQVVETSFLTFIAGDNMSLSSLLPPTDELSGVVKGTFLSIWVVGMVWSISSFGFRYRRLLHSFRVVDYNFPSQLKFDLAAKRMNKMEIVNSGLIQVPAVFGLVKPYLILPAQFSQFSAEKQLMILRHEFYHIHRGDHQINFIKVILRSLFWFNPLFYWAEKYFEADQEISCDMAVVSTSYPSEARNYAQVLIDTACQNTQDKLVSHWKYQSLITERVKMLKNINQKQWHSWVAMGIAGLSIWLTSSVVTAQKATSQATNHGDAVPTVIISPSYPRKAVEEGIEGWVRLEFNVDSNGQPYEVTVVDSQPANTFERDAVKAVYKWKFKTTEGQQRMQYTLEFKLAEDNMDKKFPE